MDMDMGQSIVYCEGDEMFLQSVLEAISTGGMSQSISDQVCTSFKEWYVRQKEDKSSLPELSPNHTPVTFKPSLPAAVTTQPSPSINLQVAASPATHLHTPNRKVQTAAAQISSSLDIEREKSIITSKSSLEAPVGTQEILAHNQNHHSCKELSKPDSTTNSINKTAEKIRPKLYKMSKPSNDVGVTSTLQNFQVNPHIDSILGKTRNRTSFDPEYEIPRLQKWFSANQHPSREQMVKFVQELNILKSRKGRRPLDLTNIIYWFKNARAAQRRATKALDDSLENEENVDMNSTEMKKPATDTVSHFLPNKNSAYMMPFHPYPHFFSSYDSRLRSEGSLISGAGVDEPYDLSLIRYSSSEMIKTNNRKSKEEDNNTSQSSTTFREKSPPVSSDDKDHGNCTRKKLSSQPRFPALLDVVSKMRQEIPLGPDNICYNSNNNSGDQGSPSSVQSGAQDNENASKTENTDKNFSILSKTSQNEGSIIDSFSINLEIKQENDEYLSHYNSGKSNQFSSYIPQDFGLELDQVKKEDADKVQASDGDSMSDSYDSQAELKLTAAAMFDYVSAMHNSVSHLTAANMAALSLAQMGQPLRIPQLTSSLALAYYPVDQRFYSHPTIPHSLSTSPPVSLPATHASHLSIRQPQEGTTHIDPRSSLHSSSTVKNSINQLNHRHPQQGSPKHHHACNKSEARKRRTRVFIDPLTEIPRLENWFTEDTHPSAFMIDIYCEELNKCEYRHKFPKLEPKNVQLWFKNHRAKIKRTKMSCNAQEDHEFTSGQDDDIDD